MQYTKALIYARFSDPRQDGSLERMVSELQAFANAQGIPVAAVIDEDDVSAWKTSDQRKGRWSEVVAGLTDGTWDCLIVRGLDRCARDMVATIQLAQLKEEKGFGFFALNGDSLGDQIVAALNGWKNWRESKDKSDRLKLKWAAKAAAGEYNHGRYRPFGYRYTYTEHGKINGLAIDPYEAEIVREVALRLSHGESAHMIALELEQRGVPTVSGGPWQRMMVVRLVKPVSAGMISHNGEILPGNHQAIITRELFWQVKAALVKGDPKPSGHNTRKHLLATLLFCSRCGVIMQCNGRVYQCVPKNTHAGKRGCGKMAITKHNIEAFVVGLTIDHLRDQRDAFQETVTEDWSPAITAAEADVASIQAAYEAGDITSSDWLTGLKIARRKLSVALEGRATQLTKLTGPNVMKLAGDDAEVRWAEMNLSQQRAVLFELFEGFVIKPGVPGRPTFDKGRVEVLWKR